MVAKIRPTELMTPIIFVSKYNLPLVKQRCFLDSNRDFIDPPQRLTSHINISYPSVPCHILPTYLPATCIEPRGTITITTATQSTTRLFSSFDCHAAFIMAVKQTWRTFSYLFTLRDINYQPCQPLDFNCHCK